MTLIRDTTGELMYTLENSDGYENVRRLADNSIRLRYNDVPIIINVHVDERYEQLLDMEVHAHEMRDKLRGMGFHVAATEADQLAYRIASLEQEV